MKKTILFIGAMVILLAITMPLCFLFNGHDYSDRKYARVYFESWPWLPLMQFEQYQDQFTDLQYVRFK